MEEQGQQAGGMPTENRNNTKEKWLKGLTIAGYAGSGLAVISLVLIVAAVVGDWHTTGSLFVVVFFLSLLMSGIGIIASLFRKRWLVAGGGCACLVLTLALGFFAAILVAVGQHHPPERDNTDNIRMTELLSLGWQSAKKNGSDVSVLSTALPVGSWWTDGRCFYTVVKSGQTIVLQGMTLHEGGYEFYLKQCDSTLAVVCPDSCYCAFGVGGGKVEHLQVRNADTESLELLVAYDTGATNIPIAALQRFDGDELHYELSAIAALLEGNYADEKEVTWSFDDAGRMSSGDSEIRKPYSVERVWDMPTNVIKLPNGQRYGVWMTELGMVLCKAVYNSDEEQWSASYEVVTRLERRDSHEWIEHRLVCGVMRSFIENDYDFSHLIDSQQPLVLLNLLLMNRNWWNENL